jgi:hypothetical protein
MRANKIDSNQPAIVDALRAAGCKVQCLNQQKDGVPDLLVYSPNSPQFCEEDQLFLLEVKNPGGKGIGLTPDQVKFHAEWPVTVVTSPEEALRAVGL